MKIFIDRGHKTEIYPALFNVEYISIELRIEQIKLKEKINLTDVSQRFQ